MEKRINLLIVIFLLIILISLISPNIHSISNIKEIKHFQDISQKGIDGINNNQTSFSLISNLSKPKIFDVTEPFYKKDFQIPIKNISNKKSCKKAEKSKISSIFVPDLKEFPFQEKKEQPIIHPTLEETVVLKVNNEIKKKREAMPKISHNKTIPKVISQKEIKPEKVSEMLEEDSDFKEIYNHAGELGYIELNNSIEVNYDNGATAVISILHSNDKKGVYLVKYSLNNQIQSFLIKLEKEEKTNATYLTIFGKDPIYNEEWGVTIDFFNKSLIKEWGHHSCSTGTCFWYGINWFMDTWVGTICGFLCDPVCTSTFTLLTCSPCIGCIVGAAGGALLTCYGNPCTWYPCLTDCDDSDGYYGSVWEYYCSGDNKRKHRLYYNYYCTSDQPTEGYCNYNSYYTDDQFVESCPHGCNNGQCLGEITCYSDLECGQDGWVGSPYCSGGDVWQYYREYDCHYPGTENSYCDYDDDPEKKQDCIGGTCENAQCVGDVYCQEQNPDYPYYCNGYCVSCSDNDLYDVCCPDEGDPEYCCPKSGPYCDTSTGECDICGGNYPFECNNDCWSCGGMGGFEVCCPASGDPTYCCNTTASMCMSDGTCCVPSIETCNNIDDDCDGTIDNFNEGCGVGACAGGTRTCTTGSWGSCSTDGLASNETCNNIDDNCDGSVDENLTQECGTDIGECIKGTQTCSAGDWSECGGSYVGPVNETCDGLDNNCNNITDEDNVCGDYPNVTLVSPTNNYVSNTGNITFNCSATDDVNLANITLWHNLNGSSYLLPNETKTITGISNSTIWTINNISMGNYMWNCLAYDNDSHWSWSENGPFSFTVTIPGLINTFLDGTAEKTLEYTQAENQTVDIRILKDSNITNTTITITGYNVSVYNHTDVEHYYWINWTVPNTNFDGGVTAVEMGETGDNLAYYMYWVGVSKYNGTFTLDTAPENVSLSIIHLSAYVENATYSPVNITINGELVAHCFDPGSAGYITHEWDITQQAQQGTNVIESIFCMNATSQYWVKWTDINSSFDIYVDIYPTDPSVFVNVSSTSTPKIWNYSGEYSTAENITGFEEELNNALGNCTADGEGYCNVSLIVYSGSEGELKLSDIEIYYEIIDDPPNVTLISPQNNNISNTGNVTFICNATDDKSLFNITLYTNITGTWQANETKTITGTSNSTNFTINNIQDDISFIWNCLVYDNASQSSWADANWTITINLPNTAPTVTNLTQYPTSLYRGEDIEIRCAVNDNETTNSSLNVSIQYQNVTNNGYIECANITYNSTNNYWRCNYTTNYSDDDLGSFDFRCNVSDGKLSSGWTTDTDTVTILNNPPIIFSCQDAHIWEDTNGSGVQIDLDDCSSDLEDSDNNLVYQINNQTNTSLIDCYINGHNITCNDPSPDQYGYSYLEVQVNDTDGGTNISLPLILITINPLPDDPNKFLIDMPGETVAWLGNEGNVVLKGNCFSGGSCDNPGSDSFIIANSTDNHVAFINSTGDLCVEVGDCSDQSATCNPARDAFIIRNSSNYNMSYIDFDGDLCLTGELYENSNP